MADSDPRSNDVALSPTVEDREGEAATPSVLRRLGERYRVTRLLGRGGMGAIYLAVDEVLGCEVALKQIHVPGDALKRLRDEVLLAQKVTHANVCRTYDLEEVEGSWLVKMEYIAGETLAERLRKGPLPVAEAVRVASTVCAGLAAAHEQGVVHRDIKPHNIMIERATARVVIMDFGIARAASLAGQTAENVSGTPDYMAPEQVRGREVDGRADLYSLGCVLYEMLTGKRLFPRDTPLAAAHAHVSDAPPALSDAVPPYVASVVARLLEKDPAARFQSASEVAAALDRPGATPKVRRTSPRRWTFLALALAALVALGLVWQIVARTRIDRSVAVLPFASPSEAEDDVRFATGFHRDLLTQLAKIGDLKVINRTSVMRYEKGARDLREIAEALGVATIVEGSVERSGTRVRIEAQLIDAHDGKIIWANNYERDLTDVFAVQSAVAEDIAYELHAKLSPGERARIERRPTASSEAYEHYLRGLEADSRPGRRPSNWAKAGESYKKAIELDPSFALAHARLAVVEGKFHWFGVDTSPARLAAARTEAERALALAPDLPETHIAIGWAHSANREYDAALRELQIAHAGAPSAAEILLNIGDIERRLGRFEDAASALRQAATLDPRAFDPLFNLGLTLYWLRRFDEADKVLAQALPLEPDSNAVPVTQAMIALVSKGDPTPARRLIARYPAGSEPNGKLTYDGFVLILFKMFPAEAAVVLAPLPFEVVTSQVEKMPKALILGQAAAARGDEAAARALYEEGRILVEAQVKAHPDDWRWVTTLGLTYALLGRKEEADREGRRAVDLLPVSRDGFTGSAILANLAHIHARIGYVDAAMAELEQLLSIPSAVSPGLLRVDPRWAPLRADARFRKLAGL